MCCGRVFIWNCRESLHGVQSLHFSSFFCQLISQVASDDVGVALSNCKLIIAFRACGIEFLQECYSLRIFTQNVIYYYLFVIFNSKREIPAV